jgi:hypothetical protein
VAERKVEGTFQLDGLLEGPVFSTDDENIINAFVKQAGGAGLKFHAAIDRARFSLLADTEPVEIRPGRESADARVVKCLNELLKNYSPEECMQLMSTLRSIEYIPGHEIQTLYGIKPDRTVAVEQRTVRADTIRPAAPPDWRYKLKLAAVLAVVLCAAIGVSAFFVPYRDIARRLIDNARPFKIQNLKIDAGPYAQFFQVEVVELDRAEGTIRIVCKASQTYPATEEELNELWKSSADSVSKRLAVEALMRNCLRCEFFDRDGDFRGQQVCYMHWQGEKKEVFSIVIPFNRYLDRVKITY